MADDPYDKASKELQDFTGQASQLAHPFLSFLPITGASISTFGGFLASETVSATDARAQRIDELQLDLGEGPCWDAILTRRPVLEPNLVARVSTSWPGFFAALQTEHIGAIFAFPLLFGPLELGAIDMYCDTPLSLSNEQQEQTRKLSPIVSRRLLHHATGRSEDTAGTSAFSRRIIHQATGMVLVQLGMTADDAILVIQARAYSDNRSMTEVAVDVVERRLRFTPLDDHSGSG